MTKFKTLANLNMHTMKKLLTSFILPALLTTIVSAQQIANVAAPASSDPNAKEQRMIKFQIACIGPVEIARYGYAEDNSKSTQPTEEEAEANANREGDKSEDTGGGRAVRVLDTPADEKPPSDLYVRVKENEYKRVICFLNCLSRATEIPVTGDSLNLYTRKTDSDGTEQRYDRFASMPIPVKGDHFLMTISKSYKTKKWTKPNIQFHDLTYIPAGSLTIINSSPDHPFACSLNDKKTLLKKTRGKISLAIPPKSNNTGIAKLTLLSPITARNKYNNEPLPFFDGYLPIRSDEKVILFPYSVLPSKSKRGAQFIQARLSM